MDAGFFRGTSADQDNRFVNKQKKLMKSMKFAENIDAKLTKLVYKLVEIVKTVSFSCIELLFYYTS